MGKKVNKCDDILFVKDIATGLELAFDDRWEFNGDYEKPTFRPSMRCNYGHNIITHCYVRDGKIEYLSDCTHDYAGKTVDCADYDDIVIP